MKTTLADGIDLYLGDCRDILPTLGVFDLVFTDPPYGHNNNNNGDLIQRHEAALGLSPNAGLNPRPIANDGPEESAALIKWFFAEIKNHLQPGCCCCCCCAGGGKSTDPMLHTL